MTPTFALALPHTPWVPARTKSFERLLSGLCANVGQWAERGVLCSRTGPVGATLEATASRVFQDREPNWSWSQKMFVWACETGATHLLQLQDDAMVAPDFWAKLRAMVDAVPDQVIGLEASHPLGPEQLRTGRRWYRTCAWLIGVGYVWPLDPELPQGLPRYIAWCGANPDKVRAANEDSLASQYLAANKFDVWHPCPTIIDHDISVESTYGNDTHHEFSMYRRPTVTWRDVPNPDALNDRSYWLSPSAPPLLPGPGTQKCWYCNEGQGTLTSPVTHARICIPCLLNLHGNLQLESLRKLGIYKT